MNRKTRFVVYGSFMVVLLIVFYIILTYHKTPENYIHMVPAIIAIICLFGAAQHMYWAVNIKDLKEEMGDIKQANRELRDIMTHGTNDSEIASNENSGLANPRRIGPGKIISRNKGIYT